MKKSNKRGSIFTLLLRNYIFFTLILVIIIASLLSFYLMRMLGILVKIDPNQIKTYNHLLSEQRYEEFPVERMLGAKGFIWVLDENYNLIYQSNQASNSELAALSARDIVCIPEYSKSPEINMRHFNNTAGQQQIAVSVKEMINNQEYYREYVFDSDYRVLYQTGDLSQEQITKLQFQLLTDTFSSQYSIQKHMIETTEGAFHVVLLFGDRKAMTSAVGRLWGSFFILFWLFYGMLVLLFILWLNRRIKKPLYLLGQVLNNYGNGEKIQTTYYGPREFVAIFDSFNEMAQRLEHSENERKRLEIARQKMLADISHDLKTPITVVQGYSKALCDGVIPQNEQMRYLEIIEKKVTGLNELINTFYEYSKMEHPDYTLILDSCDICNFLRDFVADRYSSLTLEGFNIEVEIPEEHIQCDIDTIQLERAFDNIINNAVSHNKEGTTLYFILELRQSQVCILLADNGIGIPDEIRKSIFEPFVVGEASRSNHGSGLGLSISKKIVEAHQGSITLLEPNLPYRTIFEIILPMK